MYNSGLKIHPFIFMKQLLCKQSIVPKCTLLQVLYSQSRNTKKLLAIEILAIIKSCDHTGRKQNQLSSVLLKLNFFLNKYISVATKSLHLQRDGTDVFGHFYMLIPTQHMAAENSDNI